jgi:cyclopropane fatty-acyl-phospholipid synthase-like methyltransferase
MPEQKQWFEEWFDTPYYHILYKDRDQSEAAKFIDNLYLKLEMKAGQKVLDLACGKGRHSIYLNKKGLDVMGADLSEENIRYASQFENDSLHFKVHDMRKEIREGRYDFILNMFTSFGYFDSHGENIQTLNSVYGGLKQGGEFVIDFLNTDKILAHLNESEVKDIEGIRFNVKRRKDNGFIYKHISFSDKGKDYNFMERVMAISWRDFEEYFHHVGFEIIDVFGDYQLNDYQDESDRLIFRVRKS